MDEFTNFSDMFGIKMPENKSAAKKEVKAKSQKTKSKKSASKKSTDNTKYPLPLVVNTEVGCINIEGEGEITKAEIEAKMPIPMDIVIKGDVFIGIVKVLERKDSENLSGMLIPDKEKPEYLVTDDVIENAGERKLYKAGKYGILRYPESAASNWNLKVSSYSKIGFENRQKALDLKERAEEDISIKELVNLWIKENPWITEGDFIYVFEKRENENFVTIQLQNRKISEESKTVKVKLPVKMSFLHDAGPLSVLTPEMCDGKEYVEEKEILAVVDKYFPQIYSKDNTDISYVDSINTVCVIKKGRKKGCQCKFCVNTSAADFFVDGNELQYKPKIGKIPYEIVEETFKYFRQMLPNEALVRVLYDGNTNKFSLCKMDNASLNATSVMWDDSESIASTQSVVLEMHSHNTMNAFFSEVDNHDEVLPMLYGVMGALNTRFPQLYVRAGSSGRFKNLNYEEVFEFPKVVNDTYSIVDYNNEDMLLKDIHNGKFLLAHGFRVLANGNIVWSSVQYSDEPVKLADRRFYV